MGGGLGRGERGLCGLYCRVNKAPRVLAHGTPLLSLAQSNPEGLTSMSYCSVYVLYLMVCWQKRALFKALGLLIGPLYPFPGSFLSRVFRRFELHDVPLSDPPRQLTSEARRLGMAELFRTPKIRWQPRTTSQDSFVRNKNYSDRSQSL